MSTYRITTLGCRVNHAESREIEALLRSRGLRPAPAETTAEVEVIHTCSVTNPAAAKSRQAIRRAGRRSSLVLVTGCYAGTDPAEAAAITGDERQVIPHHSPNRPAADGDFLTRLARRLDHWMGEEAGSHHPSSLRLDPPASSRQTPPALVPLPVLMPPDTPSRHIRAEIRIQDGCDAHCTFCILPRIRPVLRSKRTPDAVEEARRLVDLGHREIVLSGIFIGAFGHETARRRHQAHPEAEPLADLLDAVAAVPGLERLRISSMEPGDVTPALLDAMLANRPVVVPHLHLPLQSGADAILARMNRQYRCDDYLAMLGAVNARLTTADGIPPALTTDIICGFPGETDDDHAATLSVARRAGFLHMHVFPFSPKRGTAAARWHADFVPDAVKRARVRELIALEAGPAGLAMTYRRRLLGRTVRVILEQPAAAPGCMQGRCDHYAMVRVRTDRPRGSVVHVTVSAVGEAFLDGTEVVTRPLPVLG